jgi:hypothetical protein
VLGPAFVVAGINLKRALENGAAGTMTLVKIAAAIIIAETVLLAAALSSVGGGGVAAELMGRVVGRAVIPLLILGYIFASLNRLAEESRRRIRGSVAL